MILGVPQAFFDFLLDIACFFLAQNFRETVFLYINFISYLIWMELDSLTALKNSIQPFFFILGIPESFFDFLGDIACFLLAINIRETVFGYKYQGDCVLDIASFSLAQNFMMFMHLYTELISHLIWMEYGAPTELTN